MTPEQQASIDQFAAIGQMSKAFKILIEAGYSDALLDAAATMALTIAKRDAAKEDK